MSWASVEGKLRRTENWAACTVSWVTTSRPSPAWSGSSPSPATPKIDCWRATPAAAWVLCTSWWANTTRPFSFTSWTSRSLRTRAAPAVRDGPTGTWDSLTSRWVISSVPWCIRSSTWASRRRPTTWWPKLWPTAAWDERTTLCRTTRSPSCTCRKVRDYVQNHKKIPSNEDKRLVIIQLLRCLECWCMVAKVVVYSHKSKESLWYIYIYIVEAVFHPYVYGKSVICLKKAGYKHQDANKYICLNLFYCV